MTAFNLKRNVATTIFAFVANVGLVFFSYRLVVMQDGLAALGMWSTLMAWIFVIRLGDVGMSMAAIRYIARLDTATEGARIRVYTDTGLLLNMALFLVLVAGAYWYFSGNMAAVFPDNPEAQATGLRILPVMLSGFILTNLSGLVIGALRGIHRGYVGAWLTIAGTLCQLVTVLLLVPRLGLGGLAWGQVVQYGMMVVVGWGLFLFHLGRTSGTSGPLLPVRFSHVALREMLGFSLKAQVANLSNGFFEPLSKLLIGRFAGLEVLGLYEMAYKMISLPRNAAVSGVQATIPAATRLMETDRPAARALYARSMRMLMRSCALILGPVVLLSPLISWLWSGSYEPQLVAFSALLGLGFLGNALGAPAFTLGMASGRMAANIVSALIGLVLVSALIVLAARSGGQPWTLVAGVAATLVVTGLFIRWRNEKLLDED